MRDLRKNKRLFYCMPICYATPKVIPPPPPPCCFYYWCTRLQSRFFSKLQGMLSPCHLPYTYLTVEGCFYLNSGREILTHVAMLEICTTFLIVFTHTHPVDLL